MRLIVALIVCSLGFSSASHACSCGRQPDDQQAAVKEAFKSADLVFIGRIEGAETFRIDEDYHQAEYQRTQFYILRSWKGEKASRVYVQSAITCCLCGYEFPDSGEFLVYAYGPDKDGYYETDSCSRTRPATDITQEMVLLDDFQAKQSRTDRPDPSHEEDAPPEQ